MDEWLWGSPLPARLYGATIFLEAERLAGASRDERERLYRRLLGCSRLLASLLQCKLVGPVTVCDATSRIAGELIGAGHIRIGEAAFSIDPLSSQGIQAAIVSAIQGAAAVHTLLSNPADPSSTLEFYRQRQRMAAERSALAAGRFYGLRAGENASSFWLRRSIVEEHSSLTRWPQGPISASLPSDLRLSPALRIVEVPVLFGTSIKKAAAIQHPALQSPAAYLAGVALAPLATAAMTLCGRDLILERWSTIVDPATGRDVMQWMYAAGIVVRQSPGPLSA
jgi:hypothetical protein